MRATYRDIVRNQTGDPTSGVSVWVVPVNGTTASLITETLFTDSTGTSTAANPFTNNVDGSFQIYLNRPKRVDLVFTAVGFDTSTASDVDIAKTNTYTFNVKHYGAIGDNVTDDTTAIQAAITAGALGEIYFPAGVYRITSAVISSGAFWTTMRGDGFGSIVSLDSTAATHALKLSASWRCFIHDISIMSASSASSAIALEVSCMEPIIDNVQIWGNNPLVAGGGTFDKGLLLTGGHAGNFSNIFINGIAATSGVGLEVNGVGFSNFTNITIRPTMILSKAGIVIKDGSGLKFSNIDSVFSPVGLLIEPSTSCPSIQELAFNNCRFFGDLTGGGSTTAAAYIHTPANTTAIIDDISFSNCWYSDNGDAPGVYIHHESTASGALRNITFNNCSMSDNLTSIGDGVIIDAAANATSATTSFTGFTFDHCRIFDNVGYGVKIGTGSSAFPISFAIADCRFSNNTLGNLLDNNVGSGTKIIRNNDPVTVGDDYATFGMSFDSGSTATISSGIAGDLTIPYNLCFVDWTLSGFSNLSDTGTGSIAIDLWADSYANYPPTVADKITTAYYPNITLAVHSSGHFTPTANKNGSTSNTASSASGWHNNFYTGDVVRFNIPSPVTNFRKVQMLIRAKKGMRNA